MSTPLGGRFYHTFTKKSTERAFHIQIPLGYKVLSGFVRASGATGIISSFYNVKNGTWEVEHSPIDKEASAILQVITLVDPSDIYDVVVSAVSLIDELSEEEVKELGQRTEKYEGRVKNFSSLQFFHLDKMNLIEGKKQRSNKPSHHNIVTLICPVLNGYILTGGGFSSAYPVLASSPEICEINYNNNWPIVEHSKISTGKSSNDLMSSLTPLNPYQLSNRSTQKSNISKTYTAWSTMGAENISLTSFAIGIRLRESSQESMISRGINDKQIITLGPPKSRVKEKKVVVKVFFQSEGRWGIELPPPHGKFYFSFSVSNTPNPIMLSTFYQ